MKYKILILLAVICVLSPNANALENADVKAITAKPADNVTAPVADDDPLEPVNRAMLKFDEGVDYVLLQPVARGYRSTVPLWGRDRVSNILYNLSEPVTVINSALQADPENAFTSFWRFMFNSTVGILGVFDVATDLGLKGRQEDFGQTFAVWGWEDSSYVVLPLLGPSTLRDSLGLGVEYVADPVDIVLPNTAQDIEFGVDVLDKRTDLLPVTDDIDKNSLDKYTAYKSIYLQHRKSEIYNGNPPSDY